MAHQANHEENFNDKFQWNKSKVKTFTKTVNLLVRKKILTISQMTSDPTRAEDAIFN